MGKIELYYSYRVQKGDTLELIIQQFKKKALPLAHMERCIIDSNLNAQQVWNDEANKSPGYICHKGFSKREGKNDQDCRVYPGEWVALPYEGFLYTPVAASQRHKTEHANTAPALWVHEKQEIKIVPIMFLPGIMGSRLQNSKTKKTIWDPDNKKMMFFLSFKGLKIKQKLLGITNAPKAVPITEPAKNLFGKSKPYTTEQLDRNYAAIASEFYDTLLKTVETQLRNQETKHIYPVYVCAYDWRQDISAIAAKDVKNIYDKIKEEQETDELIIITHSMGGLVAREFLRQNPQAAQKIKAVIHGVQPVQGAVQFYAYFKCGARHFSPWWDIPGTILGNILGASKKDFAALCSDIPGALELAPTVNSKEKQWLDWDEKLEQTYDIRAQKQDIFSCYEDTSGILGFTDKSFNPTVNKLITDNINLSKAFHKKLELYCHDRTYVLSSSLVKTVQSVHIKPNNITVDLATDFCCGEPKAMRQVKNLTSEQKNLLFGIKLELSRDLANMEQEEFPDDNRALVEQMVSERLKDTYKRSWNFQDPRIQISIAETDAGDGTVPLTSQQALEVKETIKYERKEHSSFYADKTVIADVIERIKEINGETAS